MKMHAKVLAVVAAASMTLGVLAGCGSDQKPSEGDTTTPPKESTEATVPTTADYAGTYLFESVSTTADGQTTTLKVGDEMDGKIVDQGFTVSTLYADGTCTLDGSGSPSGPTKDTWTVKSPGNLEITNNNQKSEATIEGDTLTTSGTFEMDGKTYEISFTLKKASSTTRADYAGTYYVQKVSANEGDQTTEYGHGDEFMGQTLSEDFMVSTLNADGSCSLTMSASDMTMPDGTWWVVGDGEIAIEAAGERGIATIENGTMTLKKEFSLDENQYNFTYTMVKK